MSITYNDEHIPNQNSLSLNNYLDLSLKDTIINTLDRIKNNLFRLNTFKESQINIIKNSTNKFDYLHI
jgi:hypothetical protein